MHNLDIYRVKSSSLRTRKPRNIIINHTVDLLKNINKIEPKLTFDDRTMMFQSVVNLSYENIDKYRFMSHYFIEQIGNSTIGIVGTGIETFSPFLEKYADSVYKNDILITLAGDYSLDLPTQEIYQRLGQIISSVMYENNLTGYNKIVMFDDIKKKDKNVKSVKMSNFDFILLKPYIHS